MRISHNELYSICLKAFEGLSIPYGLREEAAERITDLEMICGAGVAALNGDLIAYAQRQESAPPALREPSPGNLEIDGGNRSALFFGPALTDIACARAELLGRAQLEIRNLADRRVMIAHVRHCARRGLCASAWWQEDENFQLATMGPADAAPALTGLSGGLEAEEPGTLYLNCARHAEDLPSPADTVPEGTAPQPADPQTQAERYRRGIEMPDGLWSILNGFADRVLVPESEESRLRGAGVGADDQD